MFILHRKMAAILVLVIMLSVATVYAAEAGYKQGDRAPEIKNIQLRLKQLGYYRESKKEKLDGYFSVGTTLAVKKYQRNKKLKETGMVDAETYRLLMGRELPKLDKPGNLPEKTKPIIDTARKLLGVPYRFGGETPAGFDCSGLVQYVFGKHGKRLPRMADEQFKVGSAVELKKLEPGDLVFFSTYEKGVSHCGIYLGEQQFIHASSSRGVMVSRLDDVYWKPRYMGAKRIL